MLDLTRREFISGCSAAIAALSGSRLLHLSWNTDSTAEPILVVVFLRGGMDGLHLLGPVDDADYVAARPAALRVGESGEFAGLPIGNGYAGRDFRLHKAAAPIKELYDAKRLAFVHAAGLVHGTRSHFEAMDYVERGVVGGTGRTSATGWMTRLAETVPGIGSMGLVSASDRAPDSMLGAANAMAMANPEAFSVPVGPQVANYLRSVYKGSSEVHRAGTRTLDAIEAIHKELKTPEGAWKPYVPERGAAYPDGELGQSLRTVARLIRADLGLRLAAVDYGGWDTHEGQTYTFAPRVEHLSRSLAAFANDLHAYEDRLCVVVMSEFGRRVRANQSQGTDHGHGNAMMVMGGVVAGGRILGEWPGLATEQLDQRADLAITTDYRAVLSEVASAHLGVKDVSKVFPGFKSKPVGLMVRE